MLVFRYHIKDVCFGTYIVFQDDKKQITQCIDHQIKMNIRDR